MKNVLTIRRWNEMDEAARAVLMRRAETEIGDLRQTVSEIIGDVRARGIRAVLEYTKRFDGATLKPGEVKVKPAEFDEAYSKVKKNVLEAIKKAARNVRVYHEHQKPQPLVMMEVEPGVYAGEKITPVESVGLYVPRGKGSFPSVMIMLGAPAVAAGVKKIIVCTPPGADGKADAATLAAARECGVADVYKVGGVQAIAAMAIPGGAPPIPNVAKILGPGNAFVTAAKRELYGTADVGLPAGPSEAIILADDSIDPRIAAADLLIEAEHGPDSCALLVTHSEELAKRVKPIAEKLIEKLPEPRRSFCKSGFSKYGGIIVTRSRVESIAFVNEFAPEHLEVLLEEPFEALAALGNAGEILVGPNTPITTGNFCIGVNAILPTGRFARSYSGVSIYDFLKRSSVGWLTPEGFSALAGTAATLADYEGFPAHAQAVRERLVPAPRAGQKNVRRKH